MPNPTPLEPSLEEMLTKIQQLESQLPDLSPAECTELISLLHRTANEIQVDEIRSAIRTRYVSSVSNRLARLASA
jgi:hypothetical protein